MTPERPRQPETFDEQVIARLKRLEGQISLDYAGRMARTENPKEWQQLQGMEMEDVAKVEWVVLKILEFSRKGEKGTGEKSTH
jgi:hypothetical protein